MLLGKSCQLKPSTKEKYWQPTSHEETVGVYETFFIFYFFIINMILPGVTPVSFQKTAVELLSNETVMAFVGITEFWKESVCLFHAMFGGNVTKHELDNIRCVSPALIVKSMIYCWCYCQRYISMMTMYADISFTLLSPICFIHSLCHYNRPGVTKLLTQSER